MQRRAILLVVMATLATGGSALAHHSFAAEYLPEEVTVKGDVVQFVYRNPHCEISMAVPGADGRAETWTVEWAGTGVLHGIGPTTLKPGDHVVVTGNPGRHVGNHRLRLRSIVRPADGFSWKNQRT